MNTEELTAEERDSLLRDAPFRLTERVLSVYGAALARAEAAETAHEQFRNMAEFRGGLLSKCFARAQAAESRLAEATALLQHKGPREKPFELWTQRDRDAACNAYIEVMRFLSATPAQAAGTPEQQFQEWAETHPDNPERRAPAQAAEREVTDV